MTDTSDWDIDPFVRTEVRRIYLEWIGLPDTPRPEQEQLIDTEAARITALVDEECESRQLHDRSLARQAILENELYPQLDAQTRERRQAEHTAIADHTDHQVQRLSRLHDPTRWRQSLVAPSILAEQIVIRLWGASRPLEFLELALALVSQRLEDDQPIPATHLDPLFDELDDLIEEAAAA